MAKPKLPTNDGWTDIDYDLGNVHEDSERIGRLLNEACHVFHHHAEGVWHSNDKDAYASRLAEEIRLRPGLVARLLNTDDRVVKMLTFRALELRQANDDQHGSKGAS
jgi:hypothetical protein